MTEHPEPALEDQDWELVQLPAECWKLSYAYVSWSFPGKRTFPTTPRYSKPPHYHDLLFRVQCHVELVPPEQLELNGSLAGVKSAEDSIRPYEINVGIRHEANVDESVLQPSESLTPLNHEVDNTQIQQRWHDQLHQLLGNDMEIRCHPLQHPEELDAIPWDLSLLDSPTTTSSSSTPNSPGTDLTDSECSDAEPLLSVPKAPKKTYADVVFDDRHTHDPHTVFSPSPSKPLNASALSFVPASPKPPQASSASPSSDSSSYQSSHSLYSSPTYEFHFPSLNATCPGTRANTRPLPPTLRKDEAGFYNDINHSSSAPSRTPGSTRTATPRRPSAALLPSFLADPPNITRSRASRTRAIVDRIRSKETDSTRNRRKKDASSHLRLLLSEPKPKEAAPAEDESDKNEGWITGIANPEPSEKSPRDGWIECSPNTRPSSATHKRSASSTSCTPTTPSMQSASAATFSSPAMSAASFNVPCTPAQAPTPMQTSYYPFTVPYPQYAAAAFAPSAYMQMQFQMQAHAQWMQMQMQAQGTGFGAGIQSPYSSPYNSLDGGRKHARSRQHT